MKNIKWIHIGQEYYTCVDEDIYEMVKNVTWSVSTYGYARGVQGIFLHKFLHHIILPLNGKMEIDHINRAKWDNRRCNLRYATREINRMNRGIPDNPPFPSDLEKIESKKWRREVQEYSKKQRAAVASRLLKGKPGIKGIRGIPIRDNLGNRFRNALIASRETGINSGHISSCCRGTRRSAGGRIWEYDLTTLNM